MSESSLTPAAAAALVPWSRRVERLPVVRTSTARRVASDRTDPSLPPMDARFQLEEGYLLGGFPRRARIVLQALKEHGMILPDSRVPGSACKVVDVSSLPRR